MVAKNLLFRLYQLQDEKTTLYHPLSNGFSKQEKVERYGNMIKYPAAVDLLCTHLPLWWDSAHICQIIAYSLKLLNSIYQYQFEIL